MANTFSSQVVGSAPVAPVAPVPARPAPQTQLNPAAASGPGQGGAATAQAATGALQKLTATGAAPKPAGPAAAAPATPGATPAPAQVRQWQPGANGQPVYRPGQGPVTGHVAPLAKMAAKVLAKAGRKPFMSGEAEYVTQLATRPWAVFGEDCWAGIGRTKAAEDKSALQFGMARGQDAVNEWRAADREVDDRLKRRRKKKPVRMPVGPKMAHDTGIGLFAQGFLEHCAACGLDIAGVVKAAEQASQLSPKIAAELEPLRKAAGLPLGGIAKNLLGLGARGLTASKSLGTRGLGATKSLATRGLAGARSLGSRGLGAARSMGSRGAGPAAGGAAGGAGAGGGGLASSVIDATAAPGGASILPGAASAVAPAAAGGLRGTMKTLGTRALVGAGGGVLHDAIRPPDLPADPTSDAYAWRLAKNPLIGAGLAMAGAPLAKRMLPAATYAGLGQATKSLAMPTFMGGAVGGAADSAAGAMGIDTQGQGARIGAGMGLMRGGLQGLGKGGLTPTLAKNMSALSTSRPRLAKSLKFVTDGGGWKLGATVAASASAGVVGDMRKSLAAGDVRAAQDASMRAAMEAAGVDFRLAIDKATGQLDPAKANRLILDAPKLRELSSEPIQRALAADPRFKDGQNVTDPKTGALTDEAAAYLDQALLQQTEDAGAAAGAAAAAGAVAGTGGAPSQAVTGGPVAPATATPAPAAAPNVLGFQGIQALNDMGVGPLQQILLGAAALTILAGVLSNNSGVGIAGAATGAMGLFGPMLMPGLFGGGQAAAADPAAAEADPAAAAAAAEGKVTGVRAAAKPLKPPTGPAVPGHPEQQPGGTTANRTTSDPRLVAAANIGSLLGVQVKPETAGKFANSLAAARTELAKYGLSLEKLVARPGVRARAAQIMQSADTGAVSVAVAQSQLEQLIRSEAMAAKMGR